MPKLKINDIEVEVPAGTSVLQAAEQLGIEIPRFCQHDKLSVAGNCRMCLVEVKGGPPKPQASCCMAAADGMEVFTDTDMVKQARKGVMEFLLINHPLDCPECDQGGECDLQDQAVAYGYDRSRYAEVKRVPKDKELGPVVKTVMTRCIQCTRCVRFANEIAGVECIGMLGRGEDAEITPYLEGAVATELSGNLVDICPVGALTSKPYAFKARPWELRKTESIDVMDALGSNIRVDSRADEVMRILPRLNEDINETWLADKSRLACDGLKLQRLDRPYVRKGGKLQEASWDEAFAMIVDKLGALKASEIGALVGDLVDVEAVYALKKLMQGLGVDKLECRVDGAQIDVEHPCSYRFNTTIAGLEQADAIVLVGTNPRVEAPLVNARIRKAWLAKQMPIYVVGPKVDLTYPYTHLGDGPQGIESLSFAAERPAIIVGSGALMRPDASAILSCLHTKAVVNDGWNGFNFLHTAAGRMGALMVGFTPRGGMFSFDGLKALWLLGVDTPMVGQIPSDAFVVYQGHHGDVGAQRADVILPGAAYTEKDALYVNTEGRVQAARKAVKAPGDAKEDWRIIRVCADALEIAMPFDTHSALRACIAAEHEELGTLDAIAPVAWEGFGVHGHIEPMPFMSPIDNYYQSDVISRISPTMAQCTRAFVKKG